MTTLFPLPETTSPQPSKLILINFSPIPLHFEIINLLASEGILSVVQIGNQLCLTKAHMTQLIEKLVSEKIVERQSDSGDRRIIRICLTDIGKSVLRDFNQNFLQVLTDAVSNLDESLIEELSAALEKLRDILLEM